MKSYTCLVLLLLCFGLTFSQKSEWGKIPQEQIDLSSVGFEPDAQAVILNETGDLLMTDNGYVLDYYTRIKILTENGFSYTEKAWQYNSNSKNDFVEIIDAQTLNFKDNKVQATRVEKEEIVTNKLDDGVVQLGFYFPKLLKGSIVELHLRIKRPYILFAAPWTFQNSLPTLHSSFKIKSISKPNYKLILKGKLLSEKYTNKKSTKEWELSNIPSYKKYSLVYNLYDYIESIMFQMINRYGYDDDYYKQKSWKGYKNLINRDIKRSIKNVDFKTIANKIETGDTKSETLENCIRFLRDNYEWDGYLATPTSILKENLLKTKKGNGADFNVFLQGILREKNISSELVINSLRHNGKMIISYPAFSQLETLVNIVTLDNNEKVMVDAATSSAQNIKYLNLDYFNQIVLSLDTDEDNFVTVSPNLSEYLSLQELSLEKEVYTLSVTNKSKGYYTTEPDENLSYINEPITTVSKSKEDIINGWNVAKSKVNLEMANRNFTVIENPLTALIKDLEIDEKRDFPVELNFPFLKTIQLKILIPDGYILEEDHFQKTISAFDGKLQYIQNINNIDRKTAVITWSLLVNQTIFQTKELLDYQNFVVQLSETIPKAIVIKKR